MAETSEVERAERIGRSRARLFALQALLFLTWQGLFLSEGGEAAIRTVDAVKVSAWLVWTLALLALIATGGGLMRPKAVRALLNDELTRANRAQAYRAGFWAASVCGVGLYILSLIEPLGGREAVHFMLSAAIGSALITFAVGERRARAG
jgi:hypothetical protein